MSAAAPQRVGPSAGSLASLALLGCLAALWSVVLWAELWVSRVGGTPVCAFGAEGSCSTLWDSAFASAAHRVTGLPLAAWGVAWGLAALALPLLALLRLAEGRPDPALVTAVRVVAAAGAVTVLGLLGLSAAEGALCAGCFVAYLLVSGYAGIALVGWPGIAVADAARGLGLAGAVTGACVALLLYPGRRTPRPAAEAGRAAVADAAPDLASASSRGGVPPDGPLEQLVESLDPQMKQVLADSLAAYRAAPAPKAPLPAARSLLGRSEAPVRITAFSDVLCTHCAELHETLEALRQHLPEGSFAIESRSYPLDGECNPRIPRKADPVRCVAAKALACLEGRNGTFELEGALFAGQRSLTPDKVYEQAARLLPRAQLEACVKGPDPQRRIDEDIAFATRYTFEGTPLVLVNGRQASAYGPFLYALVLTGGSADHPAFAALPPPRR